ncbi:conjugal transfer protein TraB (plasmid) [Providencia rettgeri]|uniref:TrbI/VirB10 family protein n=1 Tax=Providencia rettgeri TaxID=587 RepID=UPI00222055C1|nr:TrbI/VirB10 family protein [Providencia rettgeri]EMB3084063.1 conjugal transfer protein TraB [Providencia rettgeri]MDU7496212.1 TrbI/VirB10 family protein [Providencia rettgeri]UYV43788.1 conjugal transfer protein TraB [Providencia rettgeri]
MANINVRAKRKQTALFVLLALGLTGIGGAAWYMSLPSKPKAAAKQSRPAPNMTGVVTSSFDKNVGKSAMADLQSTASQMDKQMKQVNARIAKLEQENRAYRDKITEQDKELTALGEELTKMGNDFIHGDSNNGLPQPQQLPVGTLPTPNAQASQPIIPPPTAFYQGGQYPVGQPQINVNPVLKQGLSSMTIEYEDEQENTDLPDLPYIPSGSFAKAKVIEGADTNASVTGNTNPSPMQFRLTGKLIMPNDEVYDLSGCMVTAGGYGDISSERALVRTDRLSCKLFGHTIDMPFKGHVNFMGKNGIKGEPVIRNGKLVGYAFAGGFIDALGSGISQVGSTTVGIGASNTTTFGDVARGGLGGGVQQSGKMVSEYLIKRAEQYHAVIPVGAGVEVTVVFQEGFQLKFIEQMKKAKSQKQESQSLENSINQGITVSKQALERISLGDAVPVENSPQ